MKPVYKVIICGDRYWDRIVPIRREIRRLKRMCINERRELVIIEGEADGADLIAKAVANDENVHVCAVAALWNTRHNGAGPQRNSIMLLLEPHEVIAFHTDIERSRGTADMVQKAKKAGIPVKVHQK